MKMLKSFLDLDWDYIKLATARVIVALVVLITIPMILVLLFIIEPMSTILFMLVLVWAIAKVDTHGW